MTCECRTEGLLGFTPCDMHRRREEAAYGRALQDARDNILRHAADPVREGTERAEVLRLFADGLLHLGTPRAQEELRRWRLSPIAYWATGGPLVRRPEPTAIPGPPLKVRR